MLRFENCVDYNWDAREILRTVKGLFISGSRVLDTWRAVRDAKAGQINTVAEAQEVVQDFLADLFGETNLGDTAFDALRRVQHSNLLSGDYKDQLMEFPAMYNHLCNYLCHMKYLETTNGVPAIGSHDVKIVSITMLSPHQRDWLQANVRDAQGQLIRPHANNGRIVLQISEDLCPYYNMYCSRPGQRPPTRRPPRLLRGDVTPSDNGNSRKRDGNDNTAKK